MSQWRAEKMTCCQGRLLSTSKSLVDEHAASLINNNSTMRKEEGDLNNGNLGHQHRKDGKDARGVRELQESQSPLR